jgi:SAM-dependent methyltransferase
VSERPYRTDDAWSQAVFARRTGTVAAFLVPHLRAGMRLLDCGCGPGTITADLAHVVTPGETIGIDLREEAVAQARALARERQIATLTFQQATIYQLPFPDASFDAAFTCAVLQHLATPGAALREIRRVLRPGGVIGIADGSSMLTIRYPNNALLDRWDRLRVLEREYNTGCPAEPLPLRALLREAGFTRTEASGLLTTEVGLPAGTPEETRRVAHSLVIRVRGVLGTLALEQGWATKEELEQIAEALIAWGEGPDAFYARPAFWALGWV